MYHLLYHNCTSKESLEQLLTTSSILLPTYTYALMRAYNLKSNSQTRSKTCSLRNFPLSMRSAKATTILTMNIRKNELKIYILVSRTHVAFLKPTKCSKYIVVMLLLLLVRLFNSVRCSDCINLNVFNIKWYICFNEFVYYDTHLFAAH